jgi:hypothetical protein
MGVEISEESVGLSLGQEEEQREFSDATSYEEEEVCELNSEEEEFTNSTYSLGEYSEEYS